MVDPDRTITAPPATVRLVPGDRAALDGRLRDLDENLRCGNRALAAHALEQLATAARRSARTLRDTPAAQAEATKPRQAEGTKPRGGIAAVAALMSPRELRRAGFGFTVAYHAFGFTGGVVCLAGLGVVWWLAGGRPADFPALLDTLDQGAPLTSWHWQPVATAFVALLTAAIGDAFAATSRWALRRQAARMAATMATRDGAYEFGAYGQVPPAAGRSDTATPAGPAAGAR